MEIGDSERLVKTQKWYARVRVLVPTLVGVILIATVTVIFVTTHRSSSTADSVPAVATTKPGPQAVGSGYLATESDGVIFVQWAQTGSAVSGTAQVETLNGTPPSQTVATRTISVSGQINGSTISLSFDAGAEVFGTLSHGSFTVNFPQQDGSLAPLTFTSATAAQFNQALASLQGNTGSANSQAAAADAIATQRQTIDHAATSVGRDISELQQDSVALAGTLPPFQKDLGQAQSDLASEAKLEQQVIAEAQGGADQNQVCSDSDTVASDLDTVASDGDTVSSDADSTESAANTVRTDIGNLQKDFSALQSAQAQQPSYADGAPSQAAVNRAISTAQQAVASAIGTANGDLSQVNGYETQALKDAQAAATAGDCAGPSAPFTQPTIA